jgi:hypothetical protein
MAAPEHKHWQKVDRKMMMHEGPRSSGAARRALVSNPVLVQGFRCFHPIPGQGSTQQQETWKSEDLKIGTKLRKRKMAHNARILKI